MQANSKNGKSFKVQAVVCTAALLVALDIWLSLAHPLSKLPVASLERSETYQSIAVYKQQQVPPDLVLLGSSLMAAPVLQSEALYLNKPLSRFTHRNSQVFEADLNKKLGINTKVFCLASGGQMASDAYLIVKNVLVGNKQPCAIIYGIALRDFQDNLVPGLESTPAFQVLAKIDDISGRLFSTNLDLTKKADLAIGRIWTLWRYRVDIKTYLTLRIKKYMERTMPWVCFDKYNERHELKRQKKGIFPEEAAGTPTAWPGIALDHYSVQKTIEEYNRSYNPPEPEQLKSQFAYFKQTLSLCKKQGISIIVVNMPLSDTNKNLMPAGFYQQYLLHSEKLCKKYNAEFADLNCTPWNNKDNFVDTVHLKPAQSAPFLNALADIIANSKIANSYKRQPQTVAQNKQKKWE